MRRRVSRRRALLWAVGLLLAMSGSALAQRETTDLKTLPPGQQVAALSFCRGVYEVTLRDGSIRSFKEYDLGFKTDSSGKGPEASTPALVPTGRVRDRAFVIFAGLDELRGWLKKGC